MNRLLTILALGLSFVAVPALRAEDFPYLEFVRGLRDKGHPDLAAEYLDKLSKQPNLPKDVLAALPLEQARMQIEAASKATNDPGIRSQLYDQAKAKLEAFLAANPNSPDKPLATLDLARILVFQAKVTLDKANMQEKEPARVAGRVAARKQFTDAEQAILKAYDGINAALLNRRGDAKLTQAKLDSEYERAICQMQLIFTYDPEKEAFDRGPVALKAIDSLKIVAKRSDKAGWIAAADLIRCYDEIDDQAKADAAVKEFDQKGAQEPGRRMGKANYILMLVRKNPSDPKVKKRALEWIQEYKKDLDAPDGIRIRYKLAMACYKLAKEAKDQKGAEAKENYELAEKMFGEVEQTGSEYSALANTFKTQIVIQRKPELTKGPIDKLENFGDCYLRAQMEAAQAGEAKTEEQRQQHYKNIVAAVNRGLMLADEKVSKTQIIDARYFLVYYLLLTGDPYRAAVIGEDLARSNPGSTRAGTAGAFAINAYAMAIEDLAKSSDAKSKAAESDRARLRKLAQYIETNWKDDVAANEARHQLGIMAFKSEKYPEAVAALGRITPTYQDYIISQFQLATAALAAAKNNSAPPAGVKQNRDVYWRDLASQAYAKMPEPKDKNPEANRFYFYAKIQLASNLFAEKKYEEMGKIADQLQIRFNTLPDAPKDPDALKAMKSPSRELAEIKEELRKHVVPLAVYADFGRASAKFEDAKDPNRFKQVLKLMDPTIKKIQTKNMPEIDPRHLNAMLYLILKCSLLDGNVQQAQDTLGLIQNAVSPENQGMVFAGLVAELVMQLKELEKQGAAGKPQYDKLVVNFAAFLDSLAKQDLSKLRPEMIRFLANSYSGLKKHEASAKLLRELKKPVPPAKLKDDATDVEQKEYEEKVLAPFLKKQKESFFIQLMLAHELRLGSLDPKLDKTAAEAMRKDASKILKDLKESPDSKDWASKSLEVEEEEIYMMEAYEKFGVAANMWRGLNDKLKQGVAKNPRLKEPADRALYNFVRCMCRFGDNAKDPKKKPVYFERAAKLIIAVETNDKDMGGMKPQYDELLTNPMLQKVYAELKKGATTTGGGGGR